MAASELVQLTAVGGTGDGGVKRQLIRTPEGQPNIEVRFVPTATAVIVRFIDTFLTIMVSAIGAASTTNIIPFTDLRDLVVKTSMLALGGAGLGLLKDLLVIVGKLKQKYPLLDV